MCNYRFNIFYFHWLKMQFIVSMISNFQHNDESKKYQWIENIIDIHEINKMIASLLTKFEFNRSTFSMNVIFCIFSQSCRWIEFYRFFRRQSINVQKREKLIHIFSFSTNRFRKKRNVIIVFDLKNHEYYATYRNEHDHYSFYHTMFQLIHCNANSKKRLSNDEKNWHDDDFREFYYNFRKWKNWCKKTKYITKNLSFDDSKKVTKHFKWKFDIEQKFFQNLKTNDQFALLTRFLSKWTRVKLHVKKTNVNIKRINDVSISRICFQWNWTSWTKNEMITFEIFQNVKIMNNSIEWTHDKFWCDSYRFEFDLTNYDMIWNKNENNNIEMNIRITNKFVNKWISSNSNWNSCKKHCVLFNEFQFKFNEHRLFKWIQIESTFFVEIHSFISRVFFITLNHQNFIQIMFSSLLKIYVSFLIVHDVHDLHAFVIRVIQIALISCFHRLTNELNNESIKNFVSMHCCCNFMIVWNIDQLFS